MSDQLIQKRGRILGSITKLITYNNSAAIETDAIEKIEAKLEKLEEYWQQFTDLEDGIALIPNSESKFDQFEEDYFNCKAVLLKQIRKRSTFVNNDSQNDDSMNNKTALDLLFDQQRIFFKNIADSTANKSLANYDTITLPKLQIEPFDGEYSRWQSFCDSFKSGVDSNQNISEAHKFQLLKGYLRGDAAALLRHIPATDVNYKLAWKKLEDRYAKKKTILNDFLATFMNLPNVTIGSVKGLRSLSDTTDSVIRGIQTLGADAERRDALMIYILLTKVDAATQESWSKETINEEFPTVQRFLNFINARCDAKEGCISTQRVTRSTTLIKSLSLKPQPDCPLCNGNHTLVRCIQFRQFDAKKRRDLARQYRVCYNCLRRDHNVQTCSYQESCKMCNRRHHTMLHFSEDCDFSTSVPSTSTQSKEKTMLTQENQSTVQNNILDEDDDKPQTVLSANVLNNRCVLLPTALVNIKNCNGQNIVARALLDSGSQASLITESLVQTLRLPRQYSKVQISGLSDVNATTTRGRTSVTITSRMPERDEIAVNVLIVGKIASAIPTQHIPNSDIIQSIERFEFADPNFNKPASIDILLGADIFFKCLKPDTKSFNNNITLQSSIFGWIITGIAQDDKNIHSYSAKTNEKENIWDILQKFWSVEESPAEKPLEKTECELFYERTVTRRDDGKYIVRLPLKKDYQHLGDSYTAAYKRLLTMEQKFNRNHKFKEEYYKFIDEYEKLNHMTKADDCQNRTNQNCFYLPHHGVIKESSSTTKLRVVFDGSCKTSTGISINDILEVGPILQNNLIDIVTRFRQHKIAFAGDIEKMYRQVLVAEEDRSMQMILWRKYPNESPVPYKLNTVTYGMAPAAFLAVKTLHTLANDYQNQFPQACQAIKESFYVDDFLSGGENFETAKQLMNDVIDVLKAGGFHLRKFKSNCDKLLQHLDESDCEDLLPIQGNDAGISTLGLQWDKQADKFTYKLSSPPDGPLTKRKVLSFIAKTFDPLGWIAPITVRFKLFFQQMWIHTKDWDELITGELLNTWNQLTEDIAAVSMVKVPRYLQLHSKVHSVQVHGFCDASERAFGAVVYLRVVDDCGMIHISNIIAKSKIAPLKQISLPKLELCGAVLLSRLIKYTAQVIKLGDDNIKAWCDSMVVLAWLKGHPRQWKTFVGNRTSFISDHVPLRCWNYVKSCENPADLISRGIPAVNVVNNTLWWNGPHWLKQNEHNWAIVNKDYITDEERRSQPQFLCFGLVIPDQNDTIDGIFQYCSSFEKVKRIIARCLTWFYRGRHSKCKIELYVKAERICITHVQFKMFQDEFICLLNDKDIDKSSKLIRLSPYLDANGLMRVGGRLINSSLPDGTKHPLIIPNHHPISYLIARDIHINNFHAGPTLVTNLIRRRYWILNIRSIVRKIYHDCMKCARYRATPIQQPMGNLPAARVNPSRPFDHTGMDYAGPIQLKLRNGRGRQQLTKGYIALFICLATKATHIELVSDLSTNCFLMTLKRFTSRRGLPSQLYSDNGSNFIGAKNSQADLFLFLENNRDNIANAEFLLQHKIKFNFIPPRAPNFGGLWEANIKAVKFHLRRAVNAPLTFEDMTTILTQIEALLNSRPLSPLHDDPTDLDVLTPGHFLVGQPLVQLPEEDVTHLPVSRLSRYQQLQLRVQHFWRRWSFDYLNHLIQKSKWKTKRTTLTPGELVLIKDDNLPPSMWLIGRILHVYYGDDGIIRVANIKTKSGILKRAVNKICKLPLNDDEVKEAQQQIQH